MKSVMDCHGIEVEEMGGSVRHEQVDICPHKSWHLEGDCELTEDHVETGPEPVAFDPRPGPKLEQTKSTNPKDILARDEQRVLLHLLPSPGLIHTALAMMDGARKYGPYNWRDEGVGAGTYVSAAMRHLRDWLDGEEDAPDSGVHHLGHAAACILILLDAQAVGNLVDDRPPPAPTSDMMEEVKATGGVGGEEEDPAAGLPPYEPDMQDELEAVCTCGWKGWVSVIEWQENRATCPRCNTNMNSLPAHYDSGEALREKLREEYYAHGDLPPEDRI